MTIYIGGDPYTRDAEGEWVEAHHTHDADGASGMTVHLAAVPVMDEQLDLLQLVADNDTPLGRLHRDDFEQACRAVADDDGWVNPNLVSAWLHARFGEINPRAYSSQWAPACGPNGFMDKTNVYVPIDGEHSRGNQGKQVRLRRLRSAA